MKTRYPTAPTKAAGPWMLVVLVKIAPVTEVEADIASTGHHVPPVLTVPGRVCQHHRNIALSTGL